MQHAGLGRGSGVGAGEGPMAAARRAELQASRAPGAGYPPRANISTFGRSRVAALRSSE